MYKEITNIEDLWIELWLEEDELEDMTIHRHKKSKHYLTNRFKNFKKKMLFVRRIEKYDNVLTLATSAEVWYILKNVSHNYRSIFQKYLFEVRQVNWWWMEWNQQTAIQWFIPIDYIFIKLRNLWFEIDIKKAPKEYRDLYPKSLYKEVDILKNEDDYYVSRHALLCRKIMTGEWKKIRDSMDEEYNRNDVSNFWMHKFLWKKKIALSMKKQMKKLLDWSMINNKWDLKVYSEERQANAKAFLERYFKNKTYYGNKWTN